jgi:hypothetical protein
LAISNSQIAFANGENITVGSGTAKVAYKVNDRVYVTNATANFIAGASITSATGSTTVYHALGVYDTNLDGNRIGALITLPYTHQIAVHQPYATTSRNISGVAFNWIGTMKIDPSIDYWVDTTKAPEINNNLDLNYDNWLYLSKSWKTEWGNWGNYVYGAPVAGDKVTTNGAQYTEDGRYKREDSVTQSYSQDYIGSRSGTQDVIKENITIKHLGTFLTQDNLIPYMRSRVIEIEARGMKPGARLYTFFDNKNVSAYITPTNLGFAATSVEGSALYVDSAGRVHALFRIPNDDSLKFTVGTKLLRITDSPTNEDDIGLVTTSAESQYSAGGQAQTTQESKLTVRAPVIVQESRSDSGNFNNTFDVNTKVVVDLGEVPVASAGDSCGSKIICTKLYQLGLLDETTYIADERFGKQLRDTDLDVYIGYISWAKYAVEWMSGKNPDFMFWIRDPEIRRQVETETAIRVAQSVAGPWAEHMSYLMGVRETDNKYGKFVMSIGSKISRVLVKNKFDEKKKLSTLAKYSMIGTIMLLYAGSKIFNRTSTTKETNKIWGSV